MKNKLIAFIALMGLVVAAIVVTESTNSISPHDDPFEVVKPITEFVEGTHFTTIEVDVEQDILNTLGLNKGDSFEMFSYACPACFGFEALIKGIEHELGDDVKQFQTGFDGIPIAELDYMIKTLVDPELQAKSKLAVYELFMTQNYTPERRIELLSEPSELIEEIDASKITDEVISNSIEYAAATTDLFDAYDLNSTPSLILFGKYHVHMSEIGSPNNLFSLIHYLSSIESGT
ncbi:exported hypothetical protein [Vibrio chagasii]|nr:exported hypothetical protein [Vibrio chagasii]